MKLQDMADILDGLATTLDPHLKNAATGEMRQVSELLRKFSDESVKQFCDYVIKAKEGRPAGNGRASKSGAADHRVGELAAKINEITRSPGDHSFSAAEELRPLLLALTGPGIKDVGRQVGCQVSGKKADMADAIVVWVRNHIHAFHRAPLG